MNPEEITPAEYQENNSKDQTDDLFVPDEVLGPIIEGLIFASDQPIPLKNIKDILNEDKVVIQQDVNEGRIAEVIDRLNHKYEQVNSAFSIQKIASGYAFTTNADYAYWISKLYLNRSVRRLSQSALETLAIVAYKQPITKPEIEQIRGVNADYGLKSLLEKNLISVVGRSETVGRPLLYGTTKEFLFHFGLNTIEDLPKPREISDIMKDDDFEFEKQMKIQMEEDNEKMDINTDMESEHEE